MHLDQHPDDAPAPAVLLPKPPARATPAIAATRSRYLYTQASLRYSALRANDSTGPIRLPPGAAKAEGLHTDEDVFSRGESSLPPRERFDYLLLTMKTANGKSPRGYVRSVSAVGAAVACLVVGIIAGSILGKAGVLSRSSAEPLVTPVPKATESVPSVATIEDLTAKTKANPESAAAWTALGNAYFDANQYTAAIDAYTRSLQIEPGNADVLTDAGIMQRKLGQPQKAVELFDKAISADPRHENALYNKGVVLMHDLRDTAGARRAWEALQKLHPGFVTATGQTIEALIQNLQ
jgi:cytochrome c-type biogenesis protein CcmH/NrfG